MGQDRGVSVTRQIRRWGPSSKRFAVNKLRAALTWATSQGHIRGHDIAFGKLDLPANGRSRGRECVLTPEQHAALMAAAPPAVRDLLAFLEATGCRPAEAYHAAARHYDPARKAIVYRHDAAPPDYVHKTAKRTHKDRVIYVPDDAVARVEALVEARPTGALLRTPTGKRWTSLTAHYHFRRLRRAMGGLTVIPYSYRHTFATRWLLNGGSIKVLADLLGNSVMMIERHYGHLDADPAAMRRLLATFRSPAPAPPSPNPTGA
jgi:integrase